MSGDHSSSAPGGAPLGWGPYLAHGAYCVVVYGGGALLRAAGSFASDHPVLVASAAAAGAGVAVSRYREAHVSRGTVLELDLDATEVVTDRALSPLGRLTSPRAESLVVLVDALRQAADDDRVAGLVVRLGNCQSLQASLQLTAAVQELRDAVALLRRRGKVTVAYADTFGEGASGALLGLYLASAFEHVFMAPSGTLAVTDAGVETVFLKRALGQLGVEARLRGRKEYKNMVNMFTEQSYTGPHREAMEAIVASLRAQYFQGIAEGRRLPGGAAEAEQSVRQGPHLAPRALELRLVDGLLYRDQVYARVAEMVRAPSPEKTPLLFLRRYGAKRRRGLFDPRGQRHLFAYVAAQGGIARGESESGWDGGATSIGADTVCRALRAAAADPKVRAIILHVNSGGGSYTASDQIAREVLRAREKGLKVVAVMSGVAASGGYFISQHADAIVAQPGTLTGSIGVVYGKFYTKGMWDKLGVDWDHVDPGGNARLFSGTRDLSEADAAKFDEFLDAVYADFTAQVARGRRMEPAKVEEAARGRVWTGADALRLGLVDQLGGLHDGVERARQLLGLAEKETVRLVTFPRPGGLLASLAAGPAENSRDQDRKAGGDGAAAALPRALLASDPRLAGLLSAMPSQLRPLAAAAALSAATGQFTSVGAASVALGAAGGGAALPAEATVGPLQMML